MKNIIENKNILEVESEYNTSFDLFADTEELLLFREAFKVLTPYEKRILILYSELGTYRKVAEVIGCSYGPIAKTVNEVRNKMKKVVPYKKIAY